MITRLEIDGLRMLIDFQAFVNVVKTKLSPAELGFSHLPKLVESIRDPKAVFMKAVQQSRPNRRIDLEDVYTQLAEYINPDLLAQVPAYREVADQLKPVLEVLREKH